LKVYVYNDGLVRFATEKYNLDPKKLNEKFVHLTNFSINKKNTKFIKNNDARHKTGEESSDGELQLDSSKWDFKMLAAAY
jgi:tubulin polyglutamylase TTLL4